MNQSWIAKKLSLLRRFKVVSLMEKIGSATGSAVVSGAIHGTIGYAFGYVYASFSGLPFEQAAKAYAVGYAAIGAIHKFVAIMTEGMKEARYINGGVGVLVHSTYMYEMRRRGLMGDKLLILNSIALAMMIAYTLFGKGFAEEFANRMEDINKAAEKADNFEKGVKV